VIHKQQTFTTFLTCINTARITEKQDKTFTTECQQQHNYTKQRTKRSVTSKWSGIHWMSVTGVMWLCSMADTPA